MRKKQILRCIFLFLIPLFLLIPNSGLARDITLQWDSGPEPNVIGYKLYYKTGSSGNGVLSNYDGLGLFWTGVPYDGVPVDSGFQILKADLANDQAVECRLNGLNPSEDYYFVVTAYNELKLESVPSRELLIMGDKHPDLDPIQNYDIGWGITDTNSPLYGFKVIYNSGDPTPTLGPSEAVPSISGVLAIGLPLNLIEPSGIPFNFPVKVFIPCPGYSDTSGLNVYYYDDVLSTWYLANEASDPSNVEPGAINWMEAGSRENHNGSIAIKVYHFSGVQAGTPAPANNNSGGGGAGGCFIATASS